MPYGDPNLKEFDNYYQARSASKRERAENWAVAIGLQKVDGLTPSRYLIDVAKRHIEGDISGAAATRTTAVFAIKYLKSMRIAASNDIFAEHSWFFRNALVRANYENPLKGYHRDLEPLERFFRNLIMGERNELRNRYLLVGISDEERAALSKGLEGAAKKRSEKSGQKKAVRKSGQKTVDKLLSLLAAQPHLTQVGMVAALCITRSTVQKHLSNLKAAGKLRRVGPDKGGHWEVVG